MLLVTLNEIVYELKNIRDQLMLQLLEKILIAYDDEIAVRLRDSGMNAVVRKGLGRDVKKDDEASRFCRRRKIFSEPKAFFYGIIRPVSQVKGRKRR